MAPPLLWSEAVSVLNELAYRGEITGELADRAFDRLVDGEVGITERRPDGLLATTWRLIALAQSLGCRLVALDMRLQRDAIWLGLVVTSNEL